MKARNRSKEKCEPLEKKGAKADACVVREPREMMKHV